MQDLLWLIPALPLAGAFILIVTAGKLSKTLSAVIGCGSIGLAALITIIIGFDFISNPSQVVRQELWTWMSVDSFQPAIALYLDSLSMTFIFVITFVGFLIHVYSVEYMHDDEGFSRFFAYL